MPPELLARDVALSVAARVRVGNVDKGIGDGLPHQRMAEPFLPERLVTGGDDH
jgi:hypothetical protein